MSRRSTRNPLSRPTGHDMTVTAVKGHDAGKELMQYRPVWLSSDSSHPGTRWPVIDPDGADGDIRKFEKAYGVTVTNYRQRPRLQSESPYPNPVAVVTVSGPVTVSLDTLMPKEAPAYIKKTTMERVRGVVGARGLVVHNADNGSSSQDVILFDSWAHPDYSTVDEEE